MEEIPEKDFRKSPTVVSLLKQLCGKQQLQYCN
jgi:hypothetical protein